MNFNFPSNKTFDGFSIKSIIKNNEGKISLINIDPTKPEDNIINIGGIDYCFTYLNSSGRNKGGNSIVLKLYEIQNVDFSESGYEEPDLVIKILKYKLKKKLKFKRNIEKRFDREISILKKCNLENYQNIIKIHHNGECGIINSKNGKLEHYLYYTMEFADYDLKSYIEDNHAKINFQEKVDLCMSLANGINELNEKGYYHRDIKPDNIFMIGNTWKIGDLGLADMRDSDIKIDKTADFIGPRGWTSPEVMNKYLSEGKGFKYSYDCSIDHQSDIFQLGKVFWYIFQHNAPVGVFRTKDFKEKDNRVFSLLKSMLDYSKNKRIKGTIQVINKLKPVASDSLLSPTA